MNLKYSLCLLGLVSKVLTANFSVVSFGTNCELNVGGKIYPMAKEQDIPLFKVSAPVSLKSKYKYVCDGKEDVERELTSENTHNELIGRALTLYNMPEFGYPNAEPWERSIGRTELFDPKYVPIAIIDTDEKFFVKAHSTNFDKITFILQDKVFSFNDVPVSTKNTDEDKFQFRITLPDGGIYHRDVLKFRPSAYDPVFFRQILYGDIAHAIGNPTHESIAIRVYLNDGTGIGLWVLQEDCTSESFIRTTFFGNPKTGDILNYTPNNIYDCATGADFTASDGKSLGSFISNNEKDQKIELLAMTKKLEKLDVSNLNAVKDFDGNDFDLDTLFKALALEYLAGHWDSYWFLSTNFVTYHPIDKISASNYRFYFIDQDFDQTWGIGMSENYDPEHFPLKPYTEYLKVNWRKFTGESYDTETRIIVDKLIGCDGLPTCPTKKLFEDHLKSIVQHIFNPVAMKRKVEGYKERLMEEMTWEFSLPHLHQGSTQKYQFTMNDFINNIEGANYEGCVFYWGIMDWTTAICDTVCKQFNIKYDEVPYDPVTAAQQKDDPIDPGSKYDPKANLHNSGSIPSFLTTFNLKLTFILSMLSIIILFI
ncbi:hypothetical protein BCR32DRAFT_293063 [Anaeromyces robustus]|uniref:Coth-domain-containing protein n=1 Tax=Anaeromyces robustus TaxID=1754192 RepID=A0A1Y1X7W1_9FUNG|nr:hypothetical protein BCR32DRAFT_293063 [Anaeromyces robustus]|eukprot:ORX81842.1 hypothetical protein BCR32DRAFT_293063 [Anaeromyces robustus]